MRSLAVLVGSLRQDSINRKLAFALQKLAIGQFDFRFVDMDLPLYNDDLWGAVPDKVKALKSSIVETDGVLIVTPEYNRSIPAVTKNAVDWASRPFGQNVWKGKPVALIGASPGSQGTAVSQSQLRSTLSILGTRLMGDPEVYITFKADFLLPDGTIANEGTAKFLKSFLDQFDLWIS